MKKRAFEIIHKDEDILVISKSAGVLSIPGRYRSDTPNLAGILNGYFDEVFVCHRLDRDTSGIMVFALNAEAHKHLNEQFQTHSLTKIYHAFVAGAVIKDEIDIDIPLMPNPAEKGTTIPSSRGKESLTKLRVMERFRLATMIECNLVTGRHHQIRAHVAAIGHPLLVDDVYGGSSEFLLSSIKKRYNLKKESDERPIISRLSMHSYSIKFVHPKSNSIMEFTADYPKDLKALHQVLRKYSELPSYYYLDRENY